MSKIEEIERLKELKQETEELNEKIIKYSVYPSFALASAFVDLLTEFEKSSFTFNRLFYSYTYGIYLGGNHLFFYLKDNIENYRKYVGVSYEKTVFCPKNFRNETDYYKRLELPSYIYDFIDYAFNKRVENNLVNIKTEELHQIVEEYIKNRKEEQITTEEKQNAENMSKERETFEQTCMVDRESFFEAIADVITNSEEKASSRTHYDKQLDKNSKEDTFLLSHSVYILVNGRLRDFKVLLDKVEIPKEKEKEIQIDPPKKPYVNFFEMKNYFSYAYENLNCFKQFMDDVEALYEEKRVLEKGDINYVVENRNKDTNKIMKKQWNDKSGSL